MYRSLGKNPNPWKKIERIRLVRRTIIPRQIHGTRRECL